MKKTSNNLEFFSLILWFFNKNFCSPENLTMEKPSFIAFHAYFFLSNSFLLLYSICFHEVRVERCSYAAVYHLQPPICLESLKHLVVYHDDAILHRFEILG